MWVGRERIACSRGCRERGEPVHAEVIRETRVRFMTVEVGRERIRRAFHVEAGREKSLVRRGRKREDPVHVEVGRDRRARSRRGRKREELEPGRRREPPKEVFRKSTPRAPRGDCRPFEEGRSRRGG